METNFTNAPELLAHALESGRLPLLLSQLQKDYERANIAFPLKGTDPAGLGPGEILQGLQESLYVLLMERFDGYLNLMYAADVPERDFKSVRPTDVVEVAAQVAFLLLKREWQKVAYRSR